MKEVEVRMVVDSKSAVKSVDNLNESLDKTATSQKKVEGATKKTTSAQDASKKSSQKNASAFDGMNKATGGAMGGIKALIKQMWLLVANPIGLVIAAIALALTSLYKAFTSTKAGGEAFDQVMAGISATIDVVRDRVLIIGEALVKFFTGDFKGAMETGKKAISGFGAEVAKEFKIAANAKKDLQQVVDTMRLLSVSRAELDRDLIKAKETIESSTASYAEKKKAIDEVRIAETKQTESELAAAKKKLAAIKLQNEQSDSGAEDLDAEAAARIAVINLEKISSRNKTKFAKLQEMADIDEIARIKAIEKTTTDAANKKKKEDEEARKQKKKDDAEDQKKIDDDLKKEEKRLDDIDKLKEKYKNKNEDLDAENEEEKLQLERDRATAELDALVGTEEEKREALLALNKLYDQKETDLAKKKSDEEIAQATKTSDAKKKLDDAEKDAKLATLSAISGGLTSLAELDKENAALSKATGVASAIIDTFVGANKAFAQGGAAGFITGGAIIASGLANVATILSTPLPGGDETARPSAPTAPSFNLVEGTEGNQIQNSIQNTNETPVRAFVVAQDVTSQQSLDRQIEANAGV
mgnify:CR=1 FL=1